MAHSGGLRSRYIQSRQLDLGLFRVRYHPLEKLRTLFEKQIGPTTLAAEGFGGLGILPEDLAYVSWRGRMLIGLSWLLKRLSRLFPPLIEIADSVYVVSIKRR
jgi:hypothetical protein